MSYISAITKENDVLVWERTTEGRVIKEYTAPYYFYYQDPAGKYTTIYNEKVSKIQLQTRQEYYKVKKEFEEDGIQLYESDISPDIRVLSKHYYNKPAPKLHITLYDIEVDYNPDIGFASPSNPYAPINSIAIVHNWSKDLVVLTVPPTPNWTSEQLLKEVNNAVPEVPVPSKYNTNIIICKNEHELLLNFLAEIQDSDVLAGWNSDIFDTPYIAARIAIVLDKQKLSLTTSEIPDPYGSSKKQFKWKEDPNTLMNKCRFLKKLDFEQCMPKWRIALNGEKTKVYGIMFDTQGRIITDYMDLYKKYEPGERSSYKLAAIEQEVGLNLPKLEYSGSLHNLYRNNYPFFIRYNIRDTEILDGFEETLGYIDLANQMYHISTCLFSHVTGTLKLAEFAIINYCHHVIKKVVPNTKSPEIDRPIAGALVLLPQVGLHEWVGSIDINSLYPSSIRSINISPETLRGQFIEEGKATEEIASQTLTPLTLVLETGQKLVKSASEWNEWLRKNKWAVSGYGTVFDQNEQGIIPAILTDWYATRKKYQANKKEAEKKLSTILNKYKNV